MPAYICPSVVESVCACGLQPRSVDVQDDLNMCPVAMQAAFSTNTLAVIAAHMYGAPARIGEIEALCTAAKIFLIDDAAQVVGRRQNARLLGTFGDAGVISFAQSKTIVTGIRGSGGVLLVNKPEFHTEAKAAWQMLPVASGRLSALCNFLWNYVGCGLTGNSGYYRRTLSVLGRCGPATAGLTKISNLEAGIALAQLSRLDEILQEKIRIANAYRNALQLYPLIDFPQYAADEFLARVMLALPADVKVSEFRRVLKDQGVETCTGYAINQLQNGSAPNAAKMARRIIGVPCRPGKSSADVDDICAIMSSTITG